MTNEQAAVALRNLTTLVQFASVKGRLRDRRVNQLAVVCDNLRDLYRIAPELLDVDVIHGLAVAADKLGIDLSGKQ